MDLPKLLPSELGFPARSDSCLTCQLECWLAGRDPRLTLSLLALGAMEQRFEKLEVLHLGNIDRGSFPRLPWPGEQRLASDRA